MRTRRQRLRGRSNSSSSTALPAPAIPVAQGSRRRPCMYQDICSREMMLKVTSIVVGAEGFAIRESCQYPDGARVLVT